MTSVLKLIAFSGFVLLLTGCLNAKKMDKQVALQYPDFNAPTKKKAVDNNITVSTSLTARDGLASTTETKTSKVLPLLVYWSWIYDNNVTLNPQIPLNNLRSSVNTFAKKELIGKLQGKKLDIVVNQIPNKFTLRDKAHIIFFGYAINWDNVYLEAEKTDLQISYSVKTDSATAKNGSITIPYPSDRQNLGMFKSWKSALSEYMLQYDDNIKTMGKLVVEKLVKEL